MIICLVKRKENMKIVRRKIKGFLIGQHKVGDMVVQKLFPRGDQVEFKCEKSETYMQLADCVAA